EVVKSDPVEEYQVLSDLTVVGKRHTDHKDQRQNGEQCDEHHRRRHEQSLQVLVEERLQILPEVVHMTSLFREALGLVSALQRSAPCTYHQECEQDRRNSVEKDQDRLISFCICIDLSRLIPYFLLLHRTERRKHADAVRS